MSETVNRQILLVEKPSGKLGVEHFKLTSSVRPEPRDGTALLKVRYISPIPPTAPGCAARPIARRSKPIR